MSIPCMPLSFFFFFNDTATTEIYTLSLHDALPIFHFDDLARLHVHQPRVQPEVTEIGRDTSELQSRRDLVCRLLLEKKKKVKNFAATVEHKTSYIIASMQTFLISN